MPFRCPVEGCRKQGNLSSLRQHFGAKHPELAEQCSSARLVHLIKTKETIKMSPYDQDPEPFWKNPRVQHIITLALAAAGVGVLLAVLLSMAGVIGPQEPARPATPDAAQSRPNAR